MSVQNPANRITRWSVVGMEGMFAKMFDPPDSSPQTAEHITLAQQGLIRPNPVPEVMAAAGLQDTPSLPHTVQRDLMHGLKIPTWDAATNGGLELEFFVIGDPDNDAAQGGTYPGPTLRMPRGVIFQAESQGKGPPPHTIHWHGIEPTPLNDGVGHCSMEIGKYTYQWQPNFMGFYFLHCHRNTVQHFEFGLYSAMIFEAPDAYFGSIASTNPDGSVVLKDLNQFPIGCGRDGKRRVACNLDDPLTGNPRFTQFPGFNRRPIDSPDDQPLGVNDTVIRFPTDPHAMTVPFEVEALMVFDDRDSVWSELGDNAHATYPATGLRPGFDDNFTRNPGTDGFFAFNDFNADYWFITGVPVTARKGGTATIPANVVIPAELNSGIFGTQVSINAQTGQTVLVRCLDAAYNSLRLTFPVDVVIVAWDGRALGVKPYGHNESYLVPKGTPIDMTVARRFDALIREFSPITSTIKAEFINHNTQTPGDPDGEEVVMTALVPINIGGEVQAPPTFAFIGKVVDQLNRASQGVSLNVTPKSLGGSAPQSVDCDAEGNFRFDNITNGTYEITPVKAGKVFSPASRLVTLSNQVLTVPNFVESIASYAPGSYSLPEALDSLRSVVGLKTPTPAEFFRLNVAPLPPVGPDNIIDLRDCLDILRMVVGLNPV
jgi:hypothetical protein